MRGATVAAEIVGRESGVRAEIVKCGSEMGEKAMVSHKVMKENSGRGGWGEGRSGKGEEAGAISGSDVGSGRTKAGGARGLQGGPGGGKGEGSRWQKEQVDVHGREVW